MKVFIIDANNRIQVAAAERGIRSEEEWSRMASDWPLSRLVAIWNQLPRVAPVQRFTSRAIALQRIWKAMQDLEPRPKSAPKISLPVDTPWRASGKRQIEGPRSKKAQVIALLRRSGGASLEQIADLTGWQKHTVRGFLSTLHRKTRMNVNSSRNPNGVRVYNIHHEQ